jgi:hypothetical protein
MADPRSACWITTHWPPLVDRPHVQNIYLQEKHRTDCGIRPGDRVVVYEFKTRPKVVIPGTGRKVERAPGHEGVILAAEVVSDFRPGPPEISPQQYDEREAMNWAWEAETRPLANGHVLRREVNRILGYSEDHRFFGFNHGKGYKQIELEQYATLYCLLKARTA